MPAFTSSQMACLHTERRGGYSMQRMCEANPLHSRDEIMEALDALRRHPNMEAATEHVNRVLGLQRDGVPLINGKAQGEVLRRWSQGVALPAPRY